MVTKTQKEYKSGKNLRYEDEVYTDGTGNLVGICPIRPFRREFLSGNLTNLTNPRISKRANKVTCEYSNLDTTKNYK